MKKLYDAVLTVNSVIDNLNDVGLSDGDPEINIFTSDGTLSIYDDGKAEIYYVEKNENDRTHCTVSVMNNGSAHLSRHGAVDCEIPFAEGKEVKALYTVAPYSFDMTVKPLRIRSAITEAGGDISLFYLMNIGGQDKKVKMKISIRVK